MKNTALGNVPVSRKKIDKQVKFTTENLQQSS